MGTDKAITLTEPFTKLTSSKGRRLNARRVRGSEPQRMENAVGRASHEQVPDLSDCVFRLAGQGCVSLVSKPPLAPLVTPYCSEKINFLERWPVGVTKVKLAVSTLPQHEARQTHLPTGANDQIRDPGNHMYTRISPALLGVSSRLSLLSEK